MDGADRRSYHSAKVMTQCGFTDAALAAVRRHRMAGSIGEALAKTADAEAPAKHWSDTAAPDGPEWAGLRASRAKNALMNGGDGL